ncbi:MAG: phosphoenolpyruvate--protein phosphotransferase [Verrucomicrobia bacterium]|nr:phosphoenolpyruvate--protein phosphotransferase [Verrucomicrobiota bacterium]
MSNSLILKAPMTGPMIPIDQVPDPVFAQRMVGDGVSIDPIENRLLAPCAGTITQVHPSQHAVTIMTAAGLEIMMHIGLDTVDLKGEGFTPSVKEGDAIQTGDLLIEFDMDYVALNAKSLLTQIVVTNGEGATLSINSGFVSAGEDHLFTVDAETAPAVEQSIDLNNVLTSEPIVLANPLGLHARPAAVLAKKAKSFDASLELVCGEKKCNAKSTTAIMKMNIGSQATVLIRASGADAEAAIDGVSAEILSGLGEEVVSTSVVTEEVAVPVSDNPNELIGVSASAGIAIGTVFQLQKNELIVEEYGQDAASEQDKLEQGLRDARSHLVVFYEASASAGAEIFQAHQELLDDPEILEAATAEIKRGKSAAFAWQTAYMAESDSLASLNNVLLAERANDLRDVGERALKAILGHTDDDLQIPENSILIAEDLTPSQTATLDRTKVIGFCTVQGGSTSHVAILARSMGLPAIAGMEARALKVENGTSMILDGSKGVAEINPSDENIATIQKEMKTQAEKDARDLAACDSPATTSDDHAVTITANAASLADVQQSIKLGGGGIGLLRTELLFQSRSQAPSEEEQEQVYRNMLTTLGTKGALVVRTLDVGGDKPLPYLPIPKEDNPFLGERGIRVSLSRPELFRAQIRALLRSADAGELEIMFPMVTTVSDFTQAKAIVEEEREELGLPAVKVGMMIEVPSTALMADAFAEVVDFFSVGTNDLTQYTLAIDRGHPKLAAQADGLNPAVLNLISMAAKAMSRAGKSISVCGGLASDSQAIPLLIGLGVNKLSVSAPSVPSVKAQIRTLSLEQCKEMAAKALTLTDANDVRALVSAR